MLGLALQGGGAKGAFQAGAIKALYEEGYQFDGIVGSSIGAMNGALVAQGDIDRMYDLWYNIGISQLLDIDDKIIENLYDLNIDKETIKYVFNKLKQAIADRGFDRSKGRELISNYLDEKKLRASKIDYGLVVVERNGKLIPHRLFKEDIPEGLLVDYVIASGNLPFFNDISVGDKKLYDGGFHDNLPISMLVEKGYKDIIAIRLGNSFSPIREVKDEDVRITYIDPSEKPGSTMNFTTKTIRHTMNLGYFDTMRSLHNLMGKKYYIKRLGEDEILSVLYHYPYSIYSDIASNLGIRISVDKEGALKAIIAEVKKLMRIEKDSSDSDCITNFIEAFAEYSKVERFKIYKLDELAFKTIKGYKTTIDWNNIKTNRRIEKLKSVFDIYVDNSNDIDF